MEVTVTKLATAPVKSPAAGVSLARLRQGGLLFGASQFVGLGLGFVGSMVLTRIAAPPEVGSYLMLIQATVTVGLILQLGLGAATLRFAPVSRGQGGREATALLRRRLLGIQLAVWVLVAPPLVLAWPTIARRMNAPELAHAALLVVGVAALASLGHLLDSYLRAFRMYSAAAPLTQVLPRALILGGFLGLWLATPGSLPWEVLAAIYAGSLLVSLLAYAPALLATTGGETSEPRDAHAPPDVRTILATTTAMGLRGAASILLVSSDLWILSWARPGDSEAEAVYGIAARLIQVMTFLPGIANSLIPQEFAMLYADGRRAEMERLARGASTAVAMISAAAFLGLLLLGKPLLGLAFGDLYARGWSIALILAVGSFWDAASGSAGFALQMTGHHARLFALTAGAAVVNAALAILLVPRWGGHGVALATAVTLIALNVIMVTSARRLVGVRTFVYLEPRQWLEVLHRLARREAT